MKEVIIGIISKIEDGTEKFLLVSSKKDFEKYTGYYYPPGGHLKESEDKKTALQREIAEELGIEVIPLYEITETPGDVSGQVTYWWKCEQTSGDIKINVAELSDARFFSKEEMKNINLWPATQYFFENYIFKEKS